WVDRIIAEDRFRAEGIYGFFPANAEGDDIIVWTDESRTTERLNPEWQWHLRAVATREQAMGQDALATTHPVVQHIDTVEQASQAFDSITYQKGEAVIRMLENYVGENAWRDGVRHYMAKHKYGNTVSD
ncbi:MAG: hypothetical protein J0626_05385, partial [Rhodospirillaceae bacterium]|nr:hypothetical protein [Rhodospirillaceae bacterium]